MLNYLKDSANKTFTENGAVTLQSSGSYCLDLFATIGALRSSSTDEIQKRFMRAFAENPDQAMKILFYARDIRGGLGERSVFRTLLVWLAENEKPSLIRNLPYISEYGRWDDVLILLDTPVCKEVEVLLHEQFKNDLDALQKGEPISLLGKWLPSINASSTKAVELAKKLALAFDLTPAQYRKSLSALRTEIRIIENNLREHDYTFDYAKQPSMAMFKYRKAFVRNDKAHYQSFMHQVKEGKAKLHTSNLMPYEIVKSAYIAKESDRESLDITWNALQNFANKKNAIVVADGSLSMYWNDNPQPATVAQSLAIYFAERNHGTFRNHFITFSSKPRLVEIKGRDIVEKVRYCRSFNECATTDLQAVFDLILNTAMKHYLHQKELPSTIYIISDMEFDCITCGSSQTIFEYARMKYRKNGYTLPQVVFWNVDSRNEQQPVKMNDQGVVLVSGCTARTFSQIMSGNADPYSNMMHIIGNERYQVIQAV